MTEAKRMGENSKSFEIFKYGSSWLRADFHLHTKADKEFIYNSNPDYYISDYISALKSSGINVGVITNHNKFDYEEYKSLKKQALKNEILLLPGVELSISDGANGIHTNIVFSNEWLESGNFINSFLTNIFENQIPEQYENKNGKCSFGLVDTIKKLENFHKDFFLIFAHVEDSCGLWNELDGGRIVILGRDDFFKRRTLGFQKVRSYDKTDSEKPCRTKVRKWLNNWYPAEVEGSDCKSIEEIGKGEKCYLKLGSFSFDAVKYALTDYKNRVKTNVTKYAHSYIKNIRFTGGTLAGKELYFSPELNTLIGIRGSGKSSILEVIRYALAIPFEDKVGDKDYKEKLVGFTMGSGGKVELDIIDRYGQPYTVKRILKQEPEVYIDGKYQPGISIRETVIYKPIYFGQKDLSNTGEGFEKDLVNKILGSKLDEIRHKIRVQKEKVNEVIEQLIKVSNVKEQIDEQTSIINDTEYRLDFYKKHGVEEKLQKRLDFTNDARELKKDIDYASEFLSDLNEVITKYEDNLRNVSLYKSKYNPILFQSVYNEYKIIIEILDFIKLKLPELQKTKVNLDAKLTEFKEIERTMVEEFAAIERKLAEELKNSGTQNISPDEFLNLSKKMNTANQMLNLLTNQSSLKNELNNKLLLELNNLNKLWHEEFQITKTELDKVGNDSTSLSIKSGYKEDRQAVLLFMKDIFRGSNIRDTTYQNILDKYRDFIAIYQDIENARSVFGSNPQVLTDLFMKNIKSLLTYRVPDRFTIEYKGKELQNHSLGQRASALILFVLSQRENDLIIIDQPEDDLDNQTIYEDVIKLIRKLKPETQFIFATHNPNIPVLGDAEQVLACEFADNAIEVQSGSVDEHNIQKIIVDIMEGGREAFERRKEIYNIWKP